MDKRTLLIVVDMQNDFLTGSLANPAAVKCIPVIRDAIGEVCSVVFTRDTHFANYLETQEGKNLPVKHCIIGTEGHRVEASLEKAAQDAGIWYDYVNKETFGYDWREFRLSTEINEVVFCGTCTDICVISNVVTFKTVYPEVPVKVLASGCAGVTPDAHDAALKVMKSLQVEII